MVSRAVRAHVPRDRQALPISRDLQLVLGAMTGLVGVPQRLQQHRAPGRIGRGRDDRRLVMIASRFRRSQIQELHGIAQAHGTSIAAIVRVIVGNYLEQRRSND